MSDKDNPKADLRCFLGELTYGNAALSLGDRQKYALSEYLPLVERLKAGDAAATDDFKEKAKALLEIERQIYGSHLEYWNRVDEVKALVNSELERPRSRGQRQMNRSQFDWSAFVSEAFKLISDEGGFQLGFSQAECEKRMASWCDSNWEKQPSEASIRKYVKSAETQFTAEFRG